MLLTSHEQVVPELVHFKRISGMISEFSQVFGSSNPIGIAVLLVQSPMLWAVLGRLPVMHLFKGGP